MDHPATTPPAGANETVHVTSNLPNSAVSVTVHYKTKDTSYSGTTNGQGTADITFGSGRPTKGYTVVVDVVVGGSATCSTSFTPQ